MIINRTDISEKPQQVRGLPCDSGGRPITALGAVMFIIKPTSGATILHTGDFRASPDMESYPEFWQLDFRVDTLYLDTSYCRPEYDFPNQDDVIQRTVELVQEFLTKKPNTLVLVGAYLVGKERVFKAILESLDCKLWGDQRRVDTWRCLEDGEILSRLVGDRRRAQVQVINNSFISYPKLGLEMAPLRSVRAALGRSLLQLRGSQREHAGSARVEICDVRARPGRLVPGQRPHG